MKSYSFQAQIQKHEGMDAAFSYSHRTEYVTWIQSTKKKETRAKRMEQAITRLIEALE